MSRKRIEFDNIARTLLTLLKVEREDGRLSVTELLRETGIPSVTFYASVRDVLIFYGFAEVVVNLQEKVAAIKLAGRGRKLTICIEGLDPAKDLRLIKRVSQLA